MRNRNLLVIFIVIALTLFFASQVLAQAPIEGWDKAKFGMSPEEVRTAYSEELIEEGDKEFYKNKAYRLLSLQPRFLKGFFGLVYLYFVDNKLFEISLWFLKDRDESSVREERRFWLTLLEVENFLKQKYGTPVKEERIGERRILKWVDSKGNGLSLMVQFEHGDTFKGYFHNDERDFTVYSENPVYSFGVTYFHRELTEKWERKLTEIIMEDLFNREMVMESF